jgi:hypothetical protein
MTRTKAGTSARSWASSRLLLAMVFFSVVMVALSRISMSGAAPRRLACS